MSSRFQAEGWPIRSSLAGPPRIYLLTVIYRDGSQRVVEEVGEEDLIAVIFDQLEKLQMNRSIERITVKLKGDSEGVSEPK